MRKTRRFENIDRIEGRLFHTSRDQKVQHRRLRLPVLAEAGPGARNYHDAAKQVAVMTAVSLIRVLC